MITYSSPAQTSGVITAPPAYFCPNSICGTGNNNEDPIPCSGGTGLASLCPSSCPYCVNSNCRCTSGQNYEECRSNGDCESGNCSDTSYGKICVPIGGECLHNYNGTGGVNVCPVSKPYCVNGTCSKVSLGAICGVTGLPDDLCNNPLSLGVVGQTGITPDGMGFFCVNGICQESPGQLNDLCTSGSCGFIENNAYVCTEVTPPSITQRRCLAS
jgi:hypothetical protein